MHYDELMLKLRNKGDEEKILKLYENFNHEKEAYEAQRVLSEKYGVSIK